MLTVRLAFLQGPLRPDGPSTSPNRRRSSRSARRTVSRRCRRSVGPDGPSVRRACLSQAPGGLPERISSCFALRESPREDFLLFCSLGVSPGGFWEAAARRACRSQACCASSLPVSGLWGPPREDFLLFCSLGVSQTGFLIVLLSSREDSGRLLRVAPASPRPAARRACRS